MPLTGPFRSILAILCAAGVLAAQTATAPTTQISAAAAARFLTQASWGPTPATVAHVQQVGFENYIAEQIAAAKSSIPDVPVDPTTKRAPLGPMEQRFFVNANTGADQLRQRVMFALGQIWVVSTVKLNDAQMVTPYLRLLQSDAFTTYDKLMRDVTLSPAMGHYLDMVNNDKPNPKTGKGADENYAREVLQLFTIGLAELNSDGTQKLDSSGHSIPTFDQEVIEGFANAFTGWTYAPPTPTATPKFPEPANWTGPMVAVDAHHDTEGKLLLNGASMSAGHTAEQDLEGALSNIFNHPNVGPFVSRQLIQHLVTSNPSAAYVERIAAVFNQAPRGDLAAVVKAILLDPEARQGDNAAAAAGEGHLTEPVLFINRLLRGLGATVDATNTLTNNGNTMGQLIYAPPTVFNYFSPSYDIGGTKINAPEFELLTESTVMLRADFVNTVAFGKITGVTLDLTPYITLAGTTAAPTPDKMLSALSIAMTGSVLPQNMHDAILAAVQKATSPKAMVQTAIYLIGSAYQYQVER